MAPTGPPTMKVPLSEGKRQRPCRREGRTSNPRKTANAREKNLAPEKFLSSGSCARPLFSHSAPSPQLTRRSRSRSILCFSGRWCDFAVVRPFVRLASIAKHSWALRSSPSCSRIDSDVLLPRPSTVALVLSLACVAPLGSRLPMEPRTGALVSSVVATESRSTLCRPASWDIPSTAESYAVACVQRGDLPPAAFSSPARSERRCICGSLGTVRLRRRPGRALILAAVEHGRDRHGCLHSRLKS